LCDLVGRQQLFVPISLQRLEIIFASANAGPSGSLVDIKFLEIARQAMPSAEGLHEEYDGVPGIRGTPWQASESQRRENRLGASIHRKGVWTFQRRRTSEQVPECQHGYDPTCPEKPAGERSDRMPGTRAECPVAENCQVAIG
jgi:hypothetical protein